MFGGYYPKSNTPASNASVFGAPAANAIAPTLNEDDTDAAFYVSSGLSWDQWDALADDNSEGSASAPAPKRGRSYRNRKSRRGRRYLGTRGWSNSEIRRY